MDNNVYEGYFDNYSNLFALFGGTWPFASRDRVKKMYQIFWFVILVFVFLPTFFFQISFIIVHIKNWTENLDGFVLGLGGLMNCVKLYCVVAQRKTFEELFRIMANEQLFQPVDKEEENIVKNASRMYNFVKYVFPIVASGGVLSLLLIDIEKNQYLPLPSWYPFDVSKSPVYEMVVVNQLLAFTYLGAGSVTQEVLMVGLTSFIAIQCDLICHRLRNWKIDDEKSLVKIIETHKKVISFADKVEKLVGHVYFVQFIILVLDDAMLLFLLGQETTTIELIRFSIYLIGMYCVLFLPCWFTSEMTRRSELIPIAAYESPWTDASETSKKHLLYFMHISQTPIEMSMFGLFPISLETALSIVRTSFTYYTVLKNLAN